MPESRAAWVEALGVRAEDASDGILIAGLKRNEYEYVYDTNL